MFIKLTKSDGNPVYMNVHHIKSFYGSYGPSEDDEREPSGSVIVFDGAHLRGVEETPDEIQDLIIEEEATKRDSWMASLLGRLELVIARYVR